MTRLYSLVEKKNTMDKQREWEASIDFKGLVICITDGGPTPDSVGYIIELQLVVSRTFYWLHRPLHQG